MNIIYYEKFFKEINRIYGINKADIKEIIENLYLEFESDEKNNRKEILWIMKYTMYFLQI